MRVEVGHTGRSAGRRPRASLKRAVREDYRSHDQKKGFTVTASKRRGSSGRFPKRSEGTYCCITAWSQSRVTEVERVAV